MNVRNRSGRRSLAAVVSLATMAALATGCASGDSDDPGSSEPGAKERPYQEGILGEDSGGDPVQGGTLDFGAFSEPASLDPAVTIAAGSTGGVEMAALYDTLMRYDSAETDFVPQLAESLEKNADASEWTLTLREGVTFSDGTPLDSAAVKWSQERYVAESGPEAALWGGNVTAVETPDERTLVYKLKGPWPLFPSILSTGPGMIVAEASVKGGEFAPVGAGPFVFESYEPQEQLLLAANENYWDGRPYLDQLRSVFLGDQQTTVDSFENGSVDVAIVRDNDKVDPLLDADTDGYLNMVADSNVSIINASEGRPGADPRVRQAIAMAVDPDLIRERAYKGFGLASTDLFPDYSRWHGESSGPAYDPEAAKALVAEAKADGFDGKVTLMDQSDPASRAYALAMKASMDAVGFDTELELQTSVAVTITAVAADRDYDVAAWGLSYREGDPFSKMFSTLHSSGTSTYGMPTSPELDALIDEFQAASEESEQIEIMDGIQEQLNEQVPFISFGPVAELTAWNDEVHGVVGAMNSIVLFQDAWVG